MLSPRDDGWRAIAPGWSACLALARAGAPFHVVADRRYDRTGDRRGLGRRLASGATIYLPQVHEILPRVARLMAAARAELFGERGEACSFLFAVAGRGREGMGLHHDGPVDALWLQLEGRRTVTLGPRVTARTPQDLDTALADRGGPGWRTVDLTPGTLFSLPPFTPHRVLCRGRSLALSLTWAPPRRGGSIEGRARARAAWPVASGRASALPRASRDRLWTQVPAVIVPGGRGREVGLRVLTPDGPLDLPVSARPLARRLEAMPSLPRALLRGRHRRALAILIEHGVVGARDLPRAIVPAAPAALDGWRFG